jgi:hypothetical protein
MGEDSVDSNRAMKKLALYSEQRMLHFAISLQQLAYCRKILKNSDLIFAKM